MNGEVNGTMEEITVNSLHEPDLSFKKEEVEESNTHTDSGQCNETDQIHVVDNVSDTEKKDSVLENGTNKMEEDCKSDKSETETLKVPLEENSNNDTINNHNSSSCSNESYPESVTTQQGTSETFVDNGMHNIDEKSKDEECNKKINVDNRDNQDGECHEIDTDEDSEDDSDDDSVVSPDTIKADTVSIDSDDEDADDTSQESQMKDKDNDIIILENESQNGKSHGTASPEIHEIGSDNDDDCILTDEKSNTSAPDKMQLRRSSRAIKRKNYGLEDLDNGIESDVEEVEIDDPLGNSAKSIIINDTRSLLEMTSKKGKFGKNNQKKDPTVVIIDSQSGKNPLPVKTSSSNTLAQNIYQTIVARGTTVTPISAKNSATQNSPQRDNSTSSILPSLTDDMFVVEAPSFIVPYVYEKPSLKPFREFVDKLGKELDEQAVKEEKLRLEKAQQEKEERDKFRQERKDRGEDVSASEEEVDESKIEEKKKRKAERQEKRRRLNEDDDVSWDGESSDSSESDDDTVILKNKADSMEVIKDVTVLTADKLCSTKSDNYFDCSLGKFFVDIGLNLVQEFVQSDLLKQQNRKLIREKKSGQNTRQTQSSIASLMKNLEFSKENNAPYAFPQKKCEFCSFRTESVMVLHHHLETPHMKNNLYKCNFCKFEVKSPHDILSHMEIAHQVRGRLERAPAYHQCCNCPFEDNGKGKLARHQLACAKKFKPDLNLAPPVEWEPPAKIPKVARARSNMMGAYQSGLNRQMGNNLLRPPINIANMMPGAGFRPRGRSPLAAPARPTSVHGLPIMRSGILSRPNSGLPNNISISNNVKSKSMHQPSISITPLPRQPQPAVQPSSQTNNKSTFVICEICDGYIKDLEQLRNHMQWIHKVKIHPKMIYNRPPLNCQKCQFRFFTDQGLERHLLGSHGLVTSSMQEAANKGKDAGRCPVCGRVYQWKLLNHVAKDHNLTLKPAHLSYKCTVCTATFGMYKQFENHVYSAHSVVAKRVMDKNKMASSAAKPPTNDSLLKPLKINDEITIIPQPVKSATSTKTK